MCIVREPLDLTHSLIYISYLKCLLTVRGCRPGKTVQMTEAEVRALCLKSREIFLSQPILLELEAPLKICGKIFFPLITFLPVYILEQVSVFL